MEIDDIRKYMLGYISNNSFDPGVYYNEDGYCGENLYNEIKNYWENFKSDSDFLYFVSCEWMSDDLDLSGGRSYLLDTDDKFIGMIFKYLCKIGYDKSKYEDIIHNSTEFSDCILDMFDNIPLIRDSKIEEILDKKEDFIVVKYPKTAANPNINNIEFEFIGYSKIDNESPIYKLKLPSGFEIVKSTNDILNGK